MPRPTCSSATTSAAAPARTFRREDHLQQLVRIFKEIFEFVALRAQHFLCQLRRHLDPGHGRIFRHVADFIHLDAGLSCQRGLQLFRQRRRLGIPARERAHESRKLRLRQCRRKVNAGDA
jgi:hypothetical protein